METNVNKKNPRKFLGYLMAFVMVFFSTSSAIAEDIAVTINTANYGSEISWDITDASGAILASGTGYGNYGTYTSYATIPSGCYDMNMYDSWGDGWNGGTYSITDSTSGAVYGAGGLASGAYGVDQVCWGVTGGCTDPAATNYDPLAAFDDGSCTYASCTNVYLSMVDSWGDGWNGNTFTLTNSVGVVSFSATLASGAAGTDSVCLPDDCYTVACGGGSFASEVSWTLTDGSGNVLASGGSPASGSVCLPAVFGCTDPNAQNYDAAANTDDGSCTYPCIASDTTESFEAGTGAWYQDPSNTLDWTNWSGGTSSGSTGPLAAFDGTFYMYTETSGAGSNKTASLITDCIDLSAWTDPALVMGYHMYGATMGTLNVDVSTDGGATWTNEWTMSGDQGNVWSEAVVSLSAYSGQVAVRIQALTGTSFTSDMAIDLVRFMEAPVPGCMDPFADNYDPLATIDDGSCLYTGCTDPLATNYCATCNVNDSTLCVYPQANALDYCDDFESATLTTSGWTSIAGSEPGCVVQLTTANAIVDTVSLEMTGADGPAGWTLYSTEAQAFANVSHVSSATILYDMSANTGIVNLTFDYQTQSGFTNTAVGLVGTAYSTMRVSVNGTVLQDVNGVSWHGAETLTSLTYDLSAYAGQSNVYVTFESACKYNSNYSSGAFGDFVWVDNVCAFDVNPCTYYGVSANYAFDASCNGGSDGQASATASGDAAFTYSNTYSWTDASGAVVGTGSAVTGLAAGTYTCTATDATNGCTATTSVVIGEPSLITATGAVVDATSATNADGAVDLSVGGGTPCYTGASDTLSTWDGGTEYIWSGVAAGMTHYFDISATNGVGITGVTIKGVYAVAGNIEVWTRNGTANGNTTSSAGWTLNTSIPNTAIANGVTVYVPLMMAVGMEAGDVTGFAVHTPGDAYLTLGGFDAFSTSLASDANIDVSTGVLDANGPTFGGSATYGGFAASANFDGFIHYTAPSYTYAWSNGATTQDVSGLNMGPISCTISDCNGCQTVWSGFVMVNLVYGCTDPNASNYDPLANTNWVSATDSSNPCLYPGCTDSLATNYDPLANVNDSSCAYSCQYNGYDDAVTIHAFIDLFATEGSWQLLDANGDTVGSAAAGSMTTSALYTTELCVNNGCYQLLFQDSFGDGWVDFNGTQGWIAAINSNGDTLSYDLVTGAGGSATVSVGLANCIFGCTDSTAVNFDASATQDDGSCVYCNDNFMVLNMYDTWGDGWNGNYFTMTDGSGVQTVYQTLATGSAGSANLCLPDDCYTISCDGGSFQGEVSWELVDASGTIIMTGGAPYTGAICLPAIPGCMDSTACNYDPLANTDNGSCDFACYGCTDPVALNYDPSFTIDDGSCYYCALSASTSVVDETAAGAYDGSVDLTVTGTYCVTNTDLFVSVAGGNGQSGNAFNLINTSGADLYIDGFRQGPASGNASFIGANMEVFCAYADYTAGTPTWTSVATATVDLTAGATTGYVQIPGGVTIPAGGTYGFWVGCSNTTVQYTNGTGTVGVTPWASDANVTITEGHGGTFPTGLNFSPRNWNGSVVYGDPNAAVYTYAWNTGDTTEDLTNVTSGTYTVSITDCMGCTASASATVVVNVVPGCTDPLAFNYNPLANFDDGSCIAVALGCTDTSAANYDPNANTDDGSCHYCFGSNSVTIECTTNPWPTEVSWDLLDAAGNIIRSGGAPFLLDTCLDDGCYSIDMYDSFGDGWNGSVFSITDNTSGVSVSATLASGSFANANLTSAALGCFVYGCTDPLALNYDALANSDDGSCTYPACVTSLPFSEDFETGTADVTLLSTANGLSSIDSLNNYTSTNTYTWHGQGNGAWGATPTSGAAAFASYPDHIASMVMCVDLTAYAGQPVNVSFDLRQEFSFNANYSFFRLADDTGAVLVDGNGVDYHQPATACADAWANVSYDLSAYAGTVINLTFQSCNKYYDDYYQCGDNAYVDNIAIDIVATPVYGCTDSTAVNYDANANTDDGSCCYGNWATLNMFDSFGDGWNGNTFVMTDVLTGAVVFNSTLLSGSSGTDNNCVPDGCYDIVVGGGSWQGEVSWDLIAGSDTTSGGAPYAAQITVGAGSCAIGCTDPLAVNYDSTALVDDGSCAYPCTDNSVYVTINTDYYGTECSWDITDASGAVVASGGPYPIGYNTVLDSTCVVDGCYTLNMYDAFGDGWSIGALGSVDVTDGMGGTYANGSLPTGTSASFDFTVGTTYGCTDTAASNYDACANTDDGSCVYPCTDNEVTLVLNTGGYASEVSWNLTDGAGTVVASGAGYTASYTDSADVQTLCLVDDCYAMNMIDSYGDGWNGGTYAIYDASGALIATGGLLSGSASTDNIGIGVACPVWGCTDSTAINYDPLADTDDGSCIYPLPCNNDSFCDDFESGSFVAGNWLASSGSEAAVAVTMTNPNGTYSAEFQGGNYLGWTGGSSNTTSAQAWANTDHISQIDMCLDLSTVSGGPLNMVLDYNSTTYFGAGTGNYSWFRVLVDGTVIADANGNLDHYAPGSLTLSYDLSSYAGGNPTVTLQASCKYGDVYAGGAYNDMVWVDNLCIIAAVPGCTDSTASNYNSAATQDDGSCVYPCTDNVVALNMYDSWGDGWNGGTYTISDANGTVVATGGLLSGSFGSDTLCLADGCYDITVGGGSYDSEISFDFGTLVGSGAGTYTGVAIGAGCAIYGCTDSLANNYDPSANTDDGSCLYSGCTDSTACNYDPAANVDDGSCLTAYGCTDSTAFNYDPAATCDDGSCVAVVLGCTDPTAINYDPAANVDDGSCIAVVYGCTDPLAINYFPGANTDDGSCCYVAGCTDPAASNYDPNACIDDGSCITGGTLGCTDSTATNYDPTATVDDGSCTYAGPCTDKVTGMYMFDVVDERAKLAWDNMNTSTCMVLKYFVRYREVGTSSWTTKSAGAGNGLCQFGLNTTQKLMINLNASTTYELRMKVFYCDGNESNYNTPIQFTTADPCPPMTNLAVSTFSANTGKAQFTWDTTGVYVFARVSLRVDTSGAAWQTVGGFGVNYPTFQVNKFGLTAGESYRAQGRTFCNATISSHRSNWTSPIFWSQPGGGAKIASDVAVDNLDIYPNPSRDVFNVTFTSDESQDLEVRIINVVGEVVYSENLNEFTGEYTKQVDLTTYTKGIYFLEITTNTGVINKKLILQ